MIIWQGLGILAPIIPVLIALLFEAIIDARLGAGYTDHHPWIWGISMIVSAPGLWFFGQYLDKRPGRELIDPKTGQPVVLRKKHTFFWIPVQYCAVILAIAGIIRIFV